MKKRKKNGMRSGKRGNSLAVLDSLLWLSTGVHSVSLEVNCQRHGS